MDIMVQFSRNKKSSNSSVWRACYSKITRRKRQNIQDIQKTKSSLTFTRDTKIGHHFRKQSVPEIKVIKCSRRRKRLTLHGHHGTIQLTFDSRPNFQSIDKSVWTFASDPILLN